MPYHSFRLCQNLLKLVKTPYCWYAESVPDYVKISYDSVKTHTFYFQPLNPSFSRKFATGAWRGFLFNNNKIKKKSTPLVYPQEEANTSTLLVIPVFLEFGRSVEMLPINCMSCTQLRTKIFHPVYNVYTSFSLNRVLGRRRSQDDPLIGYFYFFIELNTLWRLLQLRGFLYIWESALPLLKPLKPPIVWVWVYVCLIVHSTTVY